MLGTCVLYTILISIDRHRTITKIAMLFIASMLRHFDVHIHSMCVCVCVLR